MKNQLFKYLLPALLWTIYTIPAIADPNDPETEDDPLPADNWLIVLFIIAIMIAMHYLYKNKTLKA